MANVAEQLDADFDAMKADFPVTITHNGTLYSGTMSSATKGRKLEEGGLFPDIDAILIMKSIDFTTKPKAGEEVLINSCFDCSLRLAYYRITSVEYPDGSVLLLSIVSLAQ
jgi:hypothetical protein|tara:strand:- start:199 stop:531 length:333 start_codon:yes stop_codon:yes gene_type:complete